MSAALLVLSRATNAVALLLSQHSVLLRSSLPQRDKRAHHEVCGVDFEGRETDVQGLGEPQEAVAVKSARTGGVVLEVLRQDINASGENHEVREVHENVRHLSSPGRARGKSRRPALCGDLDGNSSWFGNARDAYFCGTLYALRTSERRFVEKPTRAEKSVA